MASPPVPPASDEVEIDLDLFDPAQVLETILNAHWASKDHWPLGREGLIYLGEATHLVGRTLFGTEWSGDEPHLMGANLSLLHKAAYPSPAREHKPVRSVAKTRAPARQSSSVFGGVTPEQIRSNPSYKRLLLRAREPRQHVIEWKKKVAAEKAQQQLDSMNGARARMREVMRWIAIHGIEPDRLPTFWTRRDGTTIAPTFDPVEPEIWNTESLWEDLFQYCQVSTKGGDKPIRFILFLDSNALSKCLQRTANSDEQPAGPRPKYDWDAWWRVVQDIADEHGEYIQNIGLSELLRLGLRQWMKDHWPKIPGGSRMYEIYNERCAELPKPPAS